MCSSGRLMFVGLIAFSEVIVPRYCEFPHKQMQKTCKEAEKWLGVSDFNKGLTGSTSTSTSVITNSATASGTSLSSTTTMPL